MATNTDISIPSNLTLTTATRHSSAEEEKSRLLVEGDEILEELVKPGCHKVDSELNQEQEQEEEEQESLVQEDGQRESERRRLRQERGIVEPGDDALTASDWIPAVGVSIIFLAIVAFIFSQVHRS